MFSCRTHVANTKRARWAHRTRAANKKNGFASSCQLADTSV